MSSAPVNVLRWSALAFGVFYGVSHQASISAKDKSAQIQRDWDNKEKLIQQAKLEYQRKNSPAPASSESKPDLEGKNFDIEAFLHLK